MTLHGVRSYSHIETDEAFLAQFATLLTSVYQGAIPPKLAKVTIVDHHPGRVQTMRMVLNNFVANSPDIEVTPLGCRVPVGAAEVTTKPSVFVAMSFAKETWDTFYFGIQWPILAAGCRCIRVDHGPFYSGDILNQIMQHIGKADLVLADLSLLKPNVFLEAGYAWGLKKRTILLTPRAYLDSKQLPFDVQSQLHILYTDYIDLRNQLTILLMKFLASPQNQP
jgi:hypothetical protein